MECEVFTLDNKQAGKVELAEAVFGINIRRGCTVKKVRAEPVMVRSVFRSLLAAV